MSVRVVAAIIVRLISDLMMLTIPFPYDVTLHHNFPYTLLYLA